MVTEAQRRASARYVKKSVRQVVVRFYPQDEELYGWVRSQPRMGEYLRELVRRDMEATGR